MKQAQHSLLAPLNTRLDTLQLKIKSHNIELVFLWFSNLNNEKSTQILIRSL